MNCDKCGKEAELRVVEVQVAMSQQWLMGCDYAEISVCEDCDENDWSLESLIKNLKEEVMVSEKILRRPNLTENETSYRKWSAIVTRNIVERLEHVLQQEGV